MSSFVQNKKELKSPLNLSPYVKVNSSSLENAAADKDPPRRTIVSLKELIVDDGGLEDNKGVVVANAAVAAGAASNDRTKCTAPISGDGSVRCKSATENGAKCGTGAALLTPPSQESVNKTMPSPIDDSTSPSVASNNTQSDSNDSGDDLCAQATANTIAADVNNDTNNGENAKQKVRARARVSFYLFIFAIGFSEIPLRQISSSGFVSMRACNATERPPHTNGDAMHALVRCVYSICQNQFCVSGLVAYFYCLDHFRDTKSGRKINK